MSHMLENILYYFVLFGFGLAIGSFVNCLVWRTYNNISVATGRSRCVHCGRFLAWYENIPVFSYIFLKGTCRMCHKPIPAHYPAVELLGGLIFLVVGWLNKNYAAFSEWHLVRDLVFVSILAIVFLYDLLYQIIMTKLVWFGAAVGVFFNIFIFHQDIYKLLIGLAVGGGFFLLQYIISRGRWIGGGDVRLGVMMGIWLGWPNILAALFFSYMLGLVVSIPLLIFKNKQWSSAIPFGTFLAVGTFWALYCGESAIEWYIGLLR